jgi:hypothetical protein
VVVGVDISPADQRGQAARAAAARAALPQLDRLVLSIRVAEVVVEDRHQAAAPAAPAW